MEALRAEFVTKFPRIWSLFSRIWAAALVLAAVGCSQWQPREPIQPRLAEPRAESDSVTLEIAVAEIARSPQDLWHGLQNQIDTQTLPFDVRRKLDENGLSSGTLLSRLPPVFHKILETQAGDSAAANLLNGALVAHQKIQNRDGQSHWIQTALDQAQLHWSVSENGFQSSGSCELASPGFSITSYPQGDGRVRVKVTPEIRYGDQRPRIGIGEDDFSILETRKYREFKQLEFEIQLKLGHTLMVWASDGTGLGGQMFEGGPERRRFLLIRVLSTQRDDLFAPRQNDVNLTK